MSTKEKVEDKLNESKWGKEKFGDKFSWGLVILIAGVIWAAIMLIKSIRYFFN